MVKTYLRYEHSKTFSIITSTTSNSVWTKDPSLASKSKTGAGHAIVPANEEVLSWDIRKSELISRWRDDRCSAEVVCIVQSKTDLDIFAVGYGDGSIRLWDRKTGAIVMSFNGHRSGVTCLAFDGSGTKLASGGKDSTVVVWDLVSETGLFRLKGHKDQITGVEFLHRRSEEEMEVDNAVGGADGDRWLLTTSKDSSIKLWELITQHCVETHLAHHGECWKLAVSPDQKGCITAGNDGEMKVWALDSSPLTVKMSGDANCLLERGTLQRSSKDRTSTIAFHPSSDFIVTHGTDKNVEVWRIRSTEEVKKILKRKKRRKAEKGKLGEYEAAAAVDLSSATVEDVFVSYAIIRAGAKVKSVNWATKSGTKSSGQIHLLLSLTNNSLEFYSVAKPPSKEKAKKTEVPEHTKLYSVEAPGHRTDIRSVAISSDDRMLASASNGQLKIWNIRTSSCIRTFDCEYALCCSFLPGDKIVVVGTKTGEVQLFDIASSLLIQTVKAHEKEVWSLQVHPDGKSLATGSADQSVKFWNFEIVQEALPDQPDKKISQLTLVHKRILKLSDDVLSIRFTPNGKHIAASLLDNTIQVFFTDTLKRLHQLYGHKLPVLNMDISFDSKLLISCSADKNVKIWGLDFGDVHKSFFAHNDSVMAVSFERNTHNFFSASKDRNIKYWDGDKFENIITFGSPRAHFGEIWSLARGNSSNILISSSHDKSIRIWEQTDEQIFLEEERERELEALYESTLVASLDPETDRHKLEDSSSNELESGAATKQTIETLTSGERIIEALEMGIADLTVLTEHEKLKASRPPGTSIAPPQRHPLYGVLGNITAEQHLLNVISKIKPSHLQDALLILTYSQIINLLKFIAIWTSSSIASTNLVLITTILTFILTTHHNSLLSSASAAVNRATLEEIKKNLSKALTRAKDEMGFNLAALRYVGMRLDAENSGNDGKVWEEFVEEGTENAEREGKGKRKKRIFANLS